MKTRYLLLIAALLSTLTIGQSLQAQQEVDPTWFNPWPETNKSAAVQAQQHKPDAKVARASAKRQSEDLRKGDSLVRQRKQKRPVRTSSPVILASAE